MRSDAPTRHAAQFLLAFFAAAFLRVAQVPHANHGLNLEPSGLRENRQEAVPVEIAAFALNMHLRHFL